MTLRELMKKNPARPKPIAKERAVRIMVNCLCNGEFMHDWFGIVDQEFKDEQIEAICGLNPKQMDDWLTSNRFNLTIYCRVPEWVLEAAK